MPRKKRSSSPFELMDDDFDDTSSQSSRNGNPPVQRNAANARERARMRVLSSAFGRLKTKLPNIPADTKLSKLDTLRLATMYIKQLKSVVEAGAASRTGTVNGENMESISNNQENNSANCYLNFNLGVQSMNWPFGFHHHLSNSPLVRSTSSPSLVNHSSNNWCPRDNNTEEQIEHALCETEYYESHHQSQPSSFSNQISLAQHNHWYSETPSPELESTSNTCLTFESSHFQQQPEHHHHHHHQQQQPLNTSSHRYHQNLSHLQPASTHSPTFQIQHNFHHQTQQHQSSPSRYLHHNGFINS